MGLFDFGKKEIKKLSYQVEKLQRQNVFNQISRNVPLYPKWDLQYNIDRYLNTDDIYSIIRLLATNAAGTIPLYCYEVTKDKKSFNQLKREFKYDNPYKHKKIQTKALEDLPDDDPVVELLETPNQDCSKFEFFESVFSFLFLLGEVFLLKQKPDDGANQGKTVQLMIMFPQGVVLKVSETLPRKVIAYDYRINGQIIYENIPAEDVIHIKYWNPKISFLGDELRGLSPLMVLKKRLTRNDKSMDASVSQLQNGGITTIVFDENDTGQIIREGDKEVTISGKRKDNFYKFANNPANAGAPFFASGKMGAVQLGSHLTDMGITDLAKIDLKGFCNVYGISDRLFNNDATGSEISDLGARKGMYVNVLIPNVKRVRDALVKGLLSDFENGTLMEGQDGEPMRIQGDGKKRYIDLDISSITELHEDIAKKVAQYGALPIMIPNMILEEMGFPTIEDDPLMDKVYVKTGYQLLDDMEPMPPIDVITPDGN